MLEGIVLLTLGEGCRRGDEPKGFVCARFEEAQVKEPMVPPVCQHQLSQLPLLSVTSGTTVTMVFSVRAWEFGAGQCWSGMFW